MDDKLNSTQNITADAFKGELPVVLELDDEQWAAFNVLMNKPPSANAALRRLLRTPPPWAG